MNYIDRISTAALLVSASIALVAPASAAETGPNAPARWEVDYSNTACRLIRHFGEAEQTYRLVMERDWKSGSYEWALYGPALPLHPSMKSVEITLGGQEDARRFKLNGYPVTSGDHKRLIWSDRDGLIFKSLREGDLVRVTAAKNLDVSLQLTALGAATKALETCENDMFTSWGFDAPLIRSLSVRAEPSNNASQWVSNQDYPRTDFANRNEGTTTFLLTVDAKGAPTQCRIINSSGFPSLDNQACALLLTRAAFRPARDADGRAVASFYMNRVFWQVPR